MIINKDRSNTVKVPIREAYSRLADVAEIRSGYQARTRIEQGAREGLRIIQGGDIDPDLGILFSSLITIEREYGISKYSIRRDDVIFLARGAANYALSIDEDYSNLIVSNSFYLLRLKCKHISSQYLAWWLNQAEAQDFISQRRTSGSTIMYLRTRDLADTPILIPSKLVQDRVVSLDRCEKLWKNKCLDLIRLQEKLLSAVSAKAISKEQRL